MLVGRGLCGFMSECRSGCVKALDRRMSRSVALTAYVLVFAWWFATGLPTVVPKAVIGSKLSPRKIDEVAGMVCIGGMLGCG